MDNPFNTMVQGAIALHEIYLSMREGGFTQDEALDYLVKLTRQNGDNNGR